MSEESISLYPSQSLPSAFSYPVRFVDMVKKGVLPDIYPWWFVNAETETGKLFFETANSSGKNLVPFAKVDADLNDIACFDGNDNSGDPKVIMLILDESNRNYSFNNFDEWLLFAEKYANDLNEFLS